MFPTSDEFPYAFKQAYVSSFLKKNLDLASRAMQSFLHTPLRWAELETLEIEWSLG